jgi:DNA replication and repair protein RecF
VRLAWLDVQDVRSITAAHVDLAPGFTLVTGPNGSGKTNLLEAVHLAATLRPLTTATPGEVVRHGATMATVEAGLEGQVLPLQVRVVVHGNRRRAYVGGKPLRDAGAYLGTLATVAFTPDDLRLVKSGPDGRRDFLCRAAVELWPAARDELRRLERALRQRNAGLRAGASASFLAALQEPFTRAAAAVWSRRARTVATVLPHASRWLAQLLDGRTLEATLGHGLPQPPLGDPAEALAAALPATLDEDRRRGTTSCGPHHDDLDLAVDGLQARRFLSQGQQRCVALALTLGVVDAVHQARGTPPLCLLDDVSSELDQTRRLALFRALGEARCQVVATATDPALLPVPPPWDAGVARYQAHGGTFTRLA